jgi:glutamyl-tRNA reductase
MPLVACGINHHTAPLNLREKVIFTSDCMPKPLLELVDQVPVREAALLSTWNRTELYCETDEISSVLQWLKERDTVTASTSTEHWYCHADRAAVRHIMRVASGLDSMVLGEPQIFGQLKSAVVTAKEAGTLGTSLNRLFQYVFSVTKKIRSTTAIGSHPISFIFAAVTLSKRIFANLNTTSALLIGAGDSIELAAQHLNSQGIKSLCIANRTFERAEQLAHRFNGTAIPFHEIPAYLPQTDMIITATSNPLPILGKGAIESAIKIRKHRPLFIVDMAVPRDVEPEVGRLADVYLYTIDDLQSVIDENLQERRHAAQQAEAMIDVHATKYMDYVRSLDAVTTIRSFRNQMLSIRDAEMEKAQRLLLQGYSAEDVVTYLGKTLTNKLLHVPTVQLRQAATEGENDLFDSARRLFDLKEES